MILEANCEVLRSLANFYERIVERIVFQQACRHECKEDVVSFSSQMNHTIYDLRMHISRAKLLVRIVADRKVLVSICPAFRECQKLTASGR